VEYAGREAIRQHKWGKTFGDGRGKPPEQQCGRDDLERRANSTEEQDRHVARWYTFGGGCLADASAPGLEWIWGRG